MWCTLPFLLIFDWHCSLVVGSMYIHKPLLFITVGFALSVATVSFKCLSSLFHLGTKCSVLNYLRGPRARTYRPFSRCHHFKPRSAWCWCGCSLSWILKWRELVEVLLILQKSSRMCHRKDLSVLDLTTFFSFELKGTQLLDLTWGLLIAFSSFRGAIFGGQISIEMLKIEQRI